MPLLKASNLAVTIILLFIYLFLVDTAAQGNSSSSASQPHPLQTPNVAPLGQVTESQILPTDRFTETDIKELTSLGFTREQVVSELRRFNGDKTQATAALFAKSLKF